MKVIIILALVAAATASVVPKIDIEFDAMMADIESQVPTQTAAAEPRNQILINVVVSQLIAFLRRYINRNFDPLHLDSFHIDIPAGLVNLELDIEKGVASGLGKFVVNRSFLRMSDLTFDLDITVPNIVITADRYKLIGDLFSAIPLYGDGGARFDVEGFRFRALLHLKQSDNEKSILIDWIENASFEIPSLKTKLSGVIGGGDIDNVINAVIDEVIVDYINRFNGIIARTAARAIVKFGNPILDTLDTWRYISRWA